MSCAFPQSNVRVASDVREVVFPASSRIFCVCVSTPFGHSQLFAARTDDRDGERYDKAFHIGLDIPRNMINSSISIMMC